MRSLLLFVTLACWALSCYHAVQAHRTSPDASAFRAFWNNRYSEAGRGHLRSQVRWALAALAGTVFLLVS